MSQIFSRPALQLRQYVHIAFGYQYAINLGKTQIEGEGVSNSELHSSKVKKNSHSLRVVVGLVVHMPHQSRSNQRLHRWTYF